RLFVTTVESGETTELGYNVAGGYTVTGWSPDGQWLVYTKRDRDQNADVFLMNVATQEEHNLTPNPWTDSNGVITPDGTKLVFTSNRDGSQTHIFVLPLARLTEDPNDPIVKEQRRRAAATAGGGGQGGRAGGAPS